MALIDFRSEDEKQTVAYGFSPNSHRRCVCMYPCIITFHGLASWLVRKAGRLPTEQKRAIVIARGGDLGGTGGIVPLQRLGGGDGSAFIPPNI